LTAEGLLEVAFTEFHKLEENKDFPGKLLNIPAPLLSLSSYSTALSITCCCLNAVLSFKDLKSNGSLEEEVECVRQGVSASYRHRND
jgi:hypothetical protein